MNYPQRATLRVTGVLLFALVLVFNIIVMPQAQDVRMAEDICNAKINIGGLNAEIGRLAQEVLNYRSECNKVHLMKLGLDYSWIILVVGVVLFFIGVWAGLGKKAKNEILGKNPN